MRVVKKVAKKPKNLAETRDRIHLHRERREKKRVEKYRRKFKRMIKRIRFAKYQEESEFRLEFLDRWIEELTNKLEVYQKGIRRWLYEKALISLRSLRTRITRKAERLRFWLEYTRYGYIPIAVKWTGTKIELYVDEKVEERLMSPEYHDLTRDALAVIFADILRHKYKIDMKPEDLERLKGILAYMNERYKAPLREMPCKESKYMVKLTPVTFHYAKNYAVRFYVLRYMPVSTIRNDARVMVTKPMDVYFSDLRIRKPKRETVQVSTYAGDTGALSGREDIVVSRDYNREPRRLLKSYVAMTLTHRVTDSLARQLGFRTRKRNVRHCSVYISFTENQIYRGDKTQEYWYRRRYPALMSR